jgi:hypothetical protein
MKVWFRQIYVEPGVNFPFSHLFQRRLSRDVTALVEPSAEFLRKYGSEFEMTFNVSAKQDLLDNEIRGPSVFKKTKDVEYTVFLPFDVIIRHADAPRHALRFLLKGVCNAFDRLEINKAKLLDTQDSLIEGICTDPTMLAVPSWDEEANRRRVRTLFEAFFEKNKGCEPPPILQTSESEGKGKGENKGNGHM